MLYSYKHKYPEPLPNRIRLSNGLTRTSPETFTQEEILDAGYIQVPIKPTASSMQVVGWTEGTWNLVPKTQEQLDIEAPIVTNDQFLVWSPGYWIDVPVETEAPVDPELQADPGIIVDTEPQLQQVWVEPKWLVHEKTKAQLNAPIVLPGPNELIEWVPGGNWYIRDKTESELYQEALAVKVEITQRTQERLDSFARTREYDNIVSACSYATSNHPKYGVEGRYCVQARQDTWDVLYTIMADVELGNRPMPGGYSDIDGELPELIWPEPGN